MTAAADLFSARSFQGATTIVLNQRMEARFQGLRGVDILTDAGPTR